MLTVGLLAAGTQGAVAAGRATAGATCPTASARAAADGYLDALTSHDASAVPFAPDVVRVENGLVTGQSADEIREDLDTSPKYDLILALRDRTYTAIQTGVQVHYLLDVGFAGIRLATVGVTERFDVTCGRITFIKAVIGG